MSSRLLENKYAVVAGASQGIGAEIARLFATEGASLILLARNEGNLRAVAEHIRSSGGEARIRVMDVSDTDNWRRLAGWMRDEALSCDILVNNAYWRTLEPIGDVSDEAWDRTLAVSLKAYFIASREMIPFMLERGGGSIVNVSSLQSVIPEPRFGAYGVAKAGVDALSRAIARDYGPAIRANTITSGAVDTPGFAEGEEVKRELGRRLPLGRIAQGAEIARTALFLVSSMSSFITGARITADGGRSLT